MCEHERNVNGLFENSISGGPNYADLLLTIIGRQVHMASARPYISFTGSLPELIEEVCFGHIIQILIRIDAKHSHTHAHAWLDPMLVQTRTDIMHTNVRACGK